MPTVHVIDDDDSFRAAIARLLRVSGYEVRVYTSAGDFLINYPEDHAGPACILLDVGMPGPSGLELQTALAARGVLLPVVFLTGCGDIPMTVQAIKAGAIQFLTKPVDPELLLQVIGRGDATRRGPAHRTEGTSVHPGPVRAVDRTRASGTRTGSCRQAQQADRR